jgi:glycosyltransferase involved in cell wall biosynthesis
MSSTLFDLSIVIPVNDEELNIAIVSEAIERVFESTGIRIELIFVDDGSIDATWSQIKSKIHLPS